MKTAALICLPLFLALPVASFAQDESGEDAFETQVQRGRKTVKKQAKTSAKFMKKVADVLTRGGMAGCSSADFAFANTSNPQPPPPPDALGFPLTAAQLQRKWRNPPTQPSTSGNKSPSLASSDSEDEIDEVESQPWYGGSGSASGGYYTTFPPDDDDAGASAPTYYP